MNEDVLKLHRLYEAEFDLSHPASDEELAALRAQLPPEILVRYDSLKQRFGTSVLVPVEHDACSACHMTISELRRRQVEHRICDCETCGRLLFNPEVVLDSYFSSGAPAHTRRN